MKQFNSSLVSKEDSVHEELQKVLEKYFLKHPDRRFNISVFNLEYQIFDDSLIEHPRDFLMSLNWDKIDLPITQIAFLVNWLDEHEKV